MRYDNLDEMIYRALLELGLIIPTTEEGVAIVEAAMEGMEIELPESLKEPPIHLLDKRERRQMRAD